MIRPGTSLAAASVRSVTVEFTDPEFAMCRECGRRIARLADQEQWHHHIRHVERDHAAVPTTVTQS